MAWQVTLDEQGQGSVLLTVADPETGERAGQALVIRTQGRGTVISDLAWRSGGVPVLLRALQSVQHTLPPPWRFFRVASRGLYEAVRRAHDEGWPVTVEKPNRPAYDVARGLVPFQNPRGGNPSYEVEQRSQRSEGGGRGRWFLVYDREQAGEDEEPVAWLLAVPRAGGGTLVPEIATQTADPYAMFAAFQAMRQVSPPPYLGSRVENEKVYRMLQALRARGHPVGASSLSSVLRKKGYGPFRNPQGASPMEDAVMPVFWPRNPSPVGQNPRLLQRSRMALALPLFAYPEARKLPLNTEWRVRSALGRFRQTRFHSRVAKLRAARRIAAAAQLRGIALDPQGTVARWARK